MPHDLFRTYIKRIVETQPRCRTMQSGIGVSKMSNLKIQVDNNRTVRIVRNESVRNAGTTIATIERYAQKNTKFFKAIEKNEMGM